MLPKLLCLFLFFAVTSQLSAQVKLSVQGLVKKSDGTALPDKNYDLTFRFYDNENGGVALATETINTEINGGVYSAILGSNGGLDMLPFDKPYFVSVAVDGGTELLPRIALSAAPYAVSLQGASNKFPSTGTVKADALDVTGVLKATGIILPGGAPDNMGFANRGYSFGTGGDPDGGLFSLGDNNVALYANGTKALEGTNSGVTIPGSLTVNNGQTVNGALSVNGNQSVVGTFSAGVVYSESDVLAKGASNDGGFSFQDDLGFDTGLFSGGNGKCQLRADNTAFVTLDGPNRRFNVESTNESRLASDGEARLLGGGIAGNICTIDVGGAIVMNVGPANSNLGQYYMNNMKPKTGGGNFKNVQININNGVVQYDNSTRRYKYNIKPLEDNFSLILKAQPRIYTRQPHETITEIGYIAEEMDSIGLQHLVQRDKEGVVDGFDYTKMILYTVEVLKTQHADIEKLKAEVAALTAEKNALRTENTGLRADNTALQTQQADFGKQLESLSKRLKSLENAASNR